MKVGIIGTGWIADKAATTLNGLNTCEAYAVGSRKLETAQAYVKEFQLGEKPDCTKLEGLLRNRTIFGVDLIEAGLADRVCAYFTELTAGVGAVRATLHKYVVKE